MFRIACNESDCDPIVNDLRRIDDLELTSGASMCCVLVAPEGIEPSTVVPMEYLEDKGMVNPLVDWQGFGVFHRPVNLSTLFVD